MGKRATKATKKFASSGQLKKTIQARKKHQQIRKRTQGAKKSDRGPEKLKRPGHVESDDEGDRSSHETPQRTSNLKGKSVDDILSGKFMEDDDDEEMDDVLDDDSDASDDGEHADLETDDDGASFASVDELDEEGETHLEELSKLAEKDPEFYKYLQENDRELLEFNPAISTLADDEESEGGDSMEDDRRPILTQDQLRKWQKALLEHRSLRALRRLLIAFRSAAHLNEDDKVLAWSIDDSAVYQKLVVTTLRYTPVVLEHHVPVRPLTNGKFKAPVQTPKYKTLQKLILSYFNNVVYLLSQLTDNTLLQLAVTESAKLIPYIISSRKSVKSYLKKCLDLWSTGHDSVRMASFLAMRKLASAADEATIDNVLKNTYLTLVRSSRSTTAHSLPSINLMKNSASEIFCLEHVSAYQHAFGYIRQLAIHLRNSMKMKTKEAYKQVYNWQYVHSVDFWALVLARACSAQGPKSSSQENELKPLIYPLVQVILGAIKLISNSRSYPFHLHLIRSMLHLAKHTEIYIPVAPYLVPIISSTLTPSTRPKASTLRPLDFELHIRAPQQYVKTRIYVEGLVEEASFLLAEWLSSRNVQGSIAFPEIVVPITIQLRKSLKQAKSGPAGTGKELGVVKALLDRVDDGAKWTEQRRKNVNFTPASRVQVERWEEETPFDESPLSKYVKVQMKTRERRRSQLDKARNGEDELMDD